MSFFIKEAPSINPPRPLPIMNAILPLTGLAPASGPTVGPPCPGGMYTVCGDDDQSYETICEADAAGAEIVYVGECVNGWEHFNSVLVSVGTTTTIDVSTTWIPTDDTPSQIVVWIDPQSEITEATTGNNLAVSDIYTPTDRLIAIKPTAMPTAIPTATIPPQPTDQIIN